MTFKRIISSDWAIAAFILIVFLLTNNYTYGWDDQHLEITYLKHLIDPTLYAGDYYVESVTHNFTSWLYPILAKCITVSQIPAAYLILYLISRYFLFFFVYKLWLYLSQSQLTALVCTLSFIITQRTEEFLYRTFSHQEFALAIIMAGIYYFFRNRIILAAFLLGIAANFHALYSLFPMIYLLCFILFFERERRFMLLFQSGLTFMLGSLSYLALYLPKFLSHRAHIDPNLYQNWVELYLLACPQNFLFNQTPISEIFKDPKSGLLAVQAYLFLLALYLFNWIFNDDFRRNKHLQASLAGVAILLSVSFIFTYIYPVRIILDFNLIRNEQFARFLLTGFTVIYAMKTIPQVNLGRAFLMALMLGFLGMKDLFSALIILFTVGVLMLRDDFEKPLANRNNARIVLNAAVALLSVWFMVYTLIRWELLEQRGQRVIGIIVLLVINFFALLKAENNMSLRGGLGPTKQSLPAGRQVCVSERLLRSLWSLAMTRSLRQLFVILPILWMFFHFCQYHYKYLERRKHPTGFWQLQNNWEDMQRYAKAHTPKDALFFTPYNMEMGGFRIHSERKVLVCYRDCGIIGFDYLAALEWQKRIKDVEAFKVFISEPISQAIVNAITKYKVDYIVFMKYAAPKDNQVIKKIYQNEVFVLYKVNK